MYGQQRRKFKQLLLLITLCSQFLSKPSQVVKDSVLVYNLLQSPASKPSCGGASGFSTESILCALAGGRGLGGAVGRGGGKAHERREEQPARELAADGSHPLPLRRAPCARNAEVRGSRALSMYPVTEGT